MVFTTTKNALKLFETSVHAVVSSTVIVVLFPSIMFARYMIEAATTEIISKLHHGR